MDFPWWVDNGTLLALVRDGRIVPDYYDNDIDIGVVWAADTAPAILAWIHAVQTSRLFRVSLTYNWITLKLKDHRVPRIIHPTLRRYHLEWHFHVPIQVHLWRASEEAGGFWENVGVFDGPANQWFWPLVIRGRDLRQTSVRALPGTNRTLNVPHDAEAHLESLYGSTWRTPASRVSGEWSHHQHGAYEPDAWDADWFQNWR